MDVVGLGEMLPDDIDEGMEDNKQENIVDDIIEEIQVKERKQLPIDRQNIPTQDESTEALSSGGEANDDGDYDANYGNSTQNEVDGGGVSTNSSTNNKGNLLINKDAKLIQIKKRNYFNSYKQYYTLVFTPNEKINNCKIAIFLSGEQKNYPALIDNVYINRGMLGTKHLKYKNNVIEYGQVSKNERIEINYCLKEADNYTVEVNVYED